MLAAVMIWGLIALIPSVWLAVTTSLWSIAVVDIVAYGLATSLFAFRRKIPYTLRALIFILIGLSLGIIVFIATGDEGAGLFWIFAIPPFASLLLGLRWGLLFSLVTVILLIGMGLLLAFGIGVSEQVNEFSIESWIVYSANFLAANAIVTLPLGVLLEGLFQSAERQRQRLRELEAIRTVSEELRAAVTLGEILPLLMDATLKIMNASVGSIWLHDKSSDEVRIEISRGFVDALGNQFHPPPEKPGEGLAGAVFGDGVIHVSADYHVDQSLPETIRQLVPPGSGGVSVPLRSEHEIIGVLSVNTALPRVVADDEVKLLTTIAEIGGSAIRRSLLFQQTERQLQQFKVLNEIDRVILSSFDLQFSLKMLLKNIVEQLEADAANILLYDSVTQMLTSGEGEGFRTKAFGGRQIKMGEGYAGLAAAERRVIYIEDLEQAKDTSPRLAQALESEHFVSYYAAPLIAKAELRGVLEVFDRQKFAMDDDWLELITALAGRTAIAIDTLKVFESLQVSNQELTLSYDAAIEGWSKALDLRDRETEGHSQRVAELAVTLARAMGLRGRDLVNISRGGLLHDIGKMGVPDDILGKHSELTDEEWVVMKQHPTFARDMLENIGYLRDALDIPFAHHEKWDGTGYPRGLKGEQIPLAARIFAVVDVYDALTSDRPYRKAWTKEEALAYIQKESGTHFDPRIAATFLKLELP